MHRLRLSLATRFSHLPQLTLEIRRGPYAEIGSQVAMAVYNCDNRNGSYKRAEHHRTRLSVVVDGRDTGSWQPGRRKQLCQWDQQCGAGCRLLRDPRGDLSCLSLDRQRRHTGSGHPRRRFRDSHGNQFRRPGCGWGQHRVWRGPRFPVDCNIRHAGFGHIGGTSSSAVAINDLGDVTGSASQVGNIRVVAFRQAPAKKMYGLGTLGYRYSYGYAINAAATVVGSSPLNKNLTLLSRFHSQEGLPYGGPGYSRWR
jgi:probable HAF family extracellular repeat protein